MTVQGNAELVLVIMRVIKLHITNCDKCLHPRALVEGISVKEPRYSATLNTIKYQLSSL